MHVTFENTGSTEAFQKQLTVLSENTDVNSIVVLACDENAWKSEDIDPIVSSASVSVFGGVFPQIAYSGRNYSQGTLLIGLPYRSDIGVVEGLSDASATYDAAIEGWAEQWADQACNRTHFVIVDGLSARISALVDSLFFTLGLDHNFIGGGAGSLSFEQTPCVITPEGLRQDVAVLASAPLDSTIGVTHGWSPVSETLTVTSSDRNIVKSIDWQPAADVYRSLIEANGGEHIAPDNFFDVAKSYPLGIAKFGTEMVVRDPLMMTEEGYIVCVGEVPEGCSIKLLHGDVDSLITAAGEALNSAEARRQNLQEQPGYLLVDCISRVLFLGENLHRELDAVGANGPVFGAFTLGEIANSGDDYLEFYNKTTVLGILNN